MNYIIPVTSDYKRNIHIVFILFIVFESSVSQEVSIHVYYQLFLTYLYIFERGVLAPPEYDFAIKGSNYE